jgi:hypothetical protein
MTVTFEPGTIAVARPFRPRVHPVNLVHHLAQTPAPRPEVGHPLLAMSAILAAGSVAHAAHAAPWWFLAGGVVASLVFVLVTRGLFHDGGAEVVYAATSSTAAAGWLAWASDTTPWSAVSLGVLALGTISFGPVYGLLRWRRDKANRKEVQARAIAREQHKRHTWITILAKAGAKDITIASERTFRAGFALELILGPASPDFRTLASLTPSIERIAAHETGLPIRPGSIQLERGTYAHQATLVVPTRDVLNELIELPEVYGPRSIHDPLPIGQFIDGNEVKVTFRSIHGMFAGMNDAGKSNLLNVHTVLLTQCTDNVTWYIAGNKAVRGLAPWLLPFLQGEIDPSTGQPLDRPPFDWVAGDWDEAMRMLLNAYRALDGRQTMFANGADKWEPSPDDPQITILIDESPDLLINNKVKTTHKGERVTFSELVLKLVRLARSEAIQIIFLSQRGTATMIGPDGGDVKSQVVYRLGFRATGNMTDVNAVFSTDTIGVELSALPNGAFYIEQKGYLRPRLAKGYFMTPERIKTYAIANAAFVGAVDERTAALMPDYQQRWTRPNQRELLETIAGRRGPGISAQAAVADTEEEEEGEAVSPDWDELNNMLPQVPQDLIDKANRAAELDQIAQEGKEDLAKLNESLNTGLASEIAELERRLAMPVVPDEQRNTTTRPADPQQPTGEPLPADTLALLGALAATNLLYTQQRWLRSTDILTAVANMLGWPNNTEGGRRLSAALASVGVESTRESIEGKKYTVYPMVALREAIKQHHQK